MTVQESLTVTVDTVTLDPVTVDPVWKRGMDMFFVDPVTVHENGREEES